MKKAILKEGQIHIHFSFDWKVLTQIKTLEGRRFQSKGKFWTIPLSLENLIKLKEFEFELCPVLTKKLENKETSPLDKIDQDKNSINVFMQKKLYPFQKQGVGFIEEKNGRVLLADEMGLGKTIQVLAWLQLHPEKRPVIVITPASLKLNWLKEIKECMIGEMKAIVLRGKALKPINPQAKIIIINYDILFARMIDLQRVKPQVIITDECHYYKNNKTKRTKAVKKLVKNIPHFLALSGTPIINRPIEFFNVLSLLGGDMIPSFNIYVQRYCAAKYNGFGWDYSGSSNTQELYEKIKGKIMIRRLKKDVLLDLPDKTYSLIPFELDNEKEYRFAENNFIDYLKKTRGEKAAEKASGAETLTQIELLKQLSVKGILTQIISWVEDFLENENKLIIFATHKFVIDTLMEKFGEISVKIDGSVNQKNRQKAVKSFQNDNKVNLFIGNIQAAGVGLTLTASSNVVFIEYGWTSGEIEQAADRSHRIGQKDAVNIYYLLAVDSIQEKIVKLINTKSKVVSQVLDGKSIDDSGIFQSLIKELRN